MSGTAGKDKYMHPGIFILGQEQDALGDRFNSLEAFAGDITEVRYYYVKCVYFFILNFYKSDIKIFFLNLFSFV